MDRTRDNNAEQAGTSAAGTSGETAASAARRIGATLEHGKEALAEMQSAVAERTRQCMESTDTYVHENPWQAVGIAAGIGLVLGLLIARR